MRVLAIIFLLTLFYFHSFAEQTPQEEAPPTTMPPPEEMMKLRDPFKRMELQSVNEETPDSVLEKHAVESFKMIGIMTGPRQIKAVLKDPENKTHIVSENMKIGLRKGFIRKITSNIVSIQERVVNVFGQMENLETELTLQPESKVQKMATRPKQSIQLPPQQSGVVQQNLQGAPLLQHPDIRMPILQNPMPQNPMPEVLKPPGEESP